MEKLNAKQKLLMENLGFEIKETIGHNTIWKLKNDLLSVGNDKIIIWLDSDRPPDKIMLRTIFNAIYEAGQISVQRPIKLALGIK